MVVFPLVPVTPATASSSVGWPKKTSAAAAIAARTSVTTSCGTGSGSACVTTSATAPAADGLAREVVAVARRAGNAEEQRAGSRGAGVVGEVADVDWRPLDDIGRRERGDQALEVHGRQDSSVGVGAARCRPDRP